MNKASLRSAQHFWLRTLETGAADDASGGDLSFRHTTASGRRLCPLDPSLSRRFPHDYT